MTLDGLGAVLSFLLLVAPGAIWELQRAKYVPSVKETTLIELSRIVLVSLLATGMAAVVMTPLVWWPLYCAAREADEDPLASSVSSLPYILGVLATAGYACLLVFYCALRRWRGRPPITGMRLWHRFFKDRVPDQTDKPMVFVELVEQTLWKGTLLGFDSDPEDNARWLSLGPPLSRRRGDAATEVPNERWDAVLLPENQIKSIQVGYPQSSKKFSTRPSKSCDGSCATQIGERVPAEQHVTEGSNRVKRGLQKTIDLLAKVL